MLTAGQWATGQAGIAQALQVCSVLSTSDQRAVVAA
jgi:hypothetical protein